MNENGLDNVPVDQLPRLYRDLNSWYHLIIPLSTIEYESGLYKNLLIDACDGLPRTMLDLGSGAGHCAYYCKKDLMLTLVDLSPDMLSLSRKLNPECEHIVGDMRSVRLGRQFDIVLLSDAINYIADEKDLRKTAETAFSHCSSGGAALFCPDYTSESFEPATNFSCHEDGERSLRLCEWRLKPRIGTSSYDVELVFLIHSGGDDEVEIIRDRHRFGLFPKAVWMAIIEEAGFQAQCLSVRIGAQQEVVRDVFLGEKLVPSMLHAE